MSQPAQPVELTVMQAVAVLRTHGRRLVCDDPYRPRRWTPVCLVDGAEWPCAARLEADWTLRLADELLAARRAETKGP